MADKDAENAFHLFAGSKGSLNTKEAADAIRSLGYYATNSDVASRAGGNIDVGTFKSLVNQFSKPTDTDNEALSDALRLFDKSGFGKISAKEFGNFVKILGERLDEKEVAELMDFAKGGEIPYEELYTALTRE